MHNLVEAMEVYEVACSTKDEDENQGNHLLIKKTTVENNSIIKINKNDNNGHFERINKFCL